jgi:hypothetical protein
MFALPGANYIASESCSIAKKPDLRNGSTKAFRQGEDSLGRRDRKGFSIGVSQRDKTMSYYSRRQPEHHKRISFEEEFKRLLAAYGIQKE